MREKASVWIPGPQDVHCEGNRHWGVRSGLLIVGNWGDADAYELILDGWGEASELLTTNRRDALRAQ